MSESNWSSFLTKNLKEFVEFTRVESHLASPGVPDIYYNSYGETGWIENKYAESLDHKDVCRGLKKLRPAQVNWLMREAENKGRCFIFLKTDNEIVVFPGIAARKLRRFEEGTLLKHAILVLKGPRYTDQHWLQLLDLMTKR